MNHFKERTKGELGGTPFFRKGVRYLPDHWIEPLAGKEDGSEVLPYHFEIFFQSSSDMSRNLKQRSIRETLNLVAEVLKMERK